MLILPAIDLRGGQCVRLRQGDYAQETVFGSDAAAPCYDLGRRLSDAESMCSGQDAGARRERDVSRLVVVDDLQQQMRTRLAAAPDR